MRTNGSQAVAAIAFSIVILLFLANCWILKCTNRGPIGDTFGISAALFSGLAFAAFVVSMRQQQEELRNNTRLLQEQIRIDSSAARLSSLPTLIEHAVQMLIATSFLSQDPLRRKTAYEFHDDPQLQRAYLMGLAPFQIVTILSEVKKLRDELQDPQSAMKIGLEIAFSDHDDASLEEQLVAMDRGSYLLEQLASYKQDLVDLYEELKK